jgi:transposase
MNDQNSTYARLKRSARFPWRMEDTEAALMHRFQQETAPDMRRRLQALLLLRSGYPRPMVARIVNVHLRTLCDWVAWYQAGGIDAVASHRKGGLPAVHRRLSEEQCQRLRIQFQQGRIATVQQACDWVASKYHLSYTIGGMRKLLARLRSTDQIPARK